MCRINRWFNRMAAGTLLTLTHDDLFEKNRAKGHEQGWRARQIGKTCLNETAA
jgi:hypothetical protein